MGVFVSFFLGKRRKGEFHYAPDFLEGHITEHAEKRDPVFSVLKRAVL